MNSEDDQILKNLHETTLKARELAPTTLFLKKLSGNCFKYLAVPSNGQNGPICGLAKINRSAVI